MTSDLMEVVIANPLLWSVPVFAVGYAIGMAFAMNDKTRDLLADVRLAMTRAKDKHGAPGLSVDYTARCIVVPPNKLSNQLRAVDPMTALWRLFCALDIWESTWEDEFLRLRADRRKLAIVPADVSVVLEQSVLVCERSHALMDKLDQVLASRKPMVACELAMMEVKAS